MIPSMPGPGGQRMSSSQAKAKVEAMVTHWQPKPWSDGPPANAIPIIVFRQTYDVFDEPVLKQIHLPAHITRENVASYLKHRSGLEREE